MSDNCSRVRNALNCSFREKTPEDALACERCKQFGESTIPEGKQRTGRNDRQVYGRVDIYKMSTKN